MMYNWRVAAVENALAQRGKAEGPLTIEDLVSLGHLDQYHYLGTEACDELISVLGLEAGAKVLDVGAGIGGPARYIAARSGCEVLGVELQEDLVKAATDLTQRVGLANQVRFLAGDFVSICRGELDNPLRGQFDHLASLLVFCHFPDRRTALAACFECLKPGGTFLIEDLALVGPAFEQKEGEDLRDVVSAPAVTSASAYIADLEAAGFVDIDVVELTAPWKAWTKARHENYRAAREETVRLHGESLFDSRVQFYEVVDALFAGGNLGGVRITGRKRGAAEEKLCRGRHHAPAVGASSVAVLNELGSTVGSGSSGGGAFVRAPAGSSAVTGHSPGTAPVGSVQPLLPADTGVKEGPFHDSLQYHFFLPGLFIAGRVFHTGNLQTHSAWMYDIASGEMRELFAPSYATMTQSQGSDYLHLESEHLRIVDAPDLGTFAAKASGVTVSFKQSNVCAWHPTGQQDAVIHRPDLACTAEVNGQVLQGFGYSKRYYGPYPRFWGYRFIHGFTTGGEAGPTFFWNADATFGDSKYNYFKVLHPSGELGSAEARDTWQQDTSGFGLIGGARYEIRLRPLCSWSMVIGGPQQSMESRMENRYCEAELVADGKVLQAVAYNERCFGTLG